MVRDFFIRNYDYDTDLYLTLKIQGAVGSPASNSPIQIFSTNHIEIGGDLYNHIIVKDSPSTVTYANFIVDGSVFGSGFVNNYGGIILAKVGGNVEPFAGSIPVFWSYYDVIKFQVDGNFEGRLGAYSASYAARFDVGEVIVGGNFYGWNGIELNTLGSFTVEGDVDMSTAITVNNLGAGGAKTRILIGGSLKDVPNDNNNVAFYLPPLGLAANSVINFNNNGGTWDGVVAVGIRGLDQDYTRLSNDPDVDGGSVGFAPFTFQQRQLPPPITVPETPRDCDPFLNEGVVLGSTDTLTQAKLWHYGPVFVTGTGRHFRVEFKSDLSPIWVNKTHQFVTKTEDDATATSGATA